MGFGKLFKGLFGGKDSGTINDKPFGDTTLPTAEVASAAAVPPGVAIKPTPRCLVDSEEIIGERARLLGYRVTARRVDGARIDGAELHAALINENLGALAARRLIVLPLRAEQWAEADFSPLIGGRSVVQLLDLPAAEAEAAALAASIRGAGAGLVLNLVLLERHPGLAQQLTAVLIDPTAYGFEVFMRKLAAIREAHPQLQIWIEQVSSWTEHRMLQGHGASVSIGGFAATPDEELKESRLGQSRLVLIEMLNLLRREADLEALEEVAKRDPGVALKLIEIANSPLAGLSRPVASLHQAFLILGREALYRWISLGIYRAAGDPRDETLLELALTRARFLELVGQRCGARADELFLVGMFSLLDSLLGLPMVEVVGRMQLPDVVKHVLLRSEGPYGPFLRLALLSERARDEQAAQLAGTLGIDVDEISVCRSIAFMWTQEALQTH